MGEDGENGWRGDVPLSKKEKGRILTCLRGFKKSMEAPMLKGNPKEGCSRTNAPLFASVP